MKLCPGQFESNTQKYIFVESVQNRYDIHHQILSNWQCKKTPFFRGYGSNFEREGDRYRKLQAVETELSCPAGGVEGFSGFIQNIESYSENSREPRVEKNSTLENLE